MTRLILLDPPNPGPEWAPFAGVRPIAELRAGAFRIWERWNRLLAATSVGVISPATPAFADVDSIELVDPDAVVGPAIVALSTFAPLGEDLRLLPGTRALVAEGSVVAWVLDEGERWSGPRPPADGVEVKGLRLAAATDLITACERLLEADCTALARDGQPPVPPGSVVLGDPAALVVKTASVEPHVIFDVRKGPIVLEPDAVVRAGTRLEGPLYVGSHSWLLGGAIRHSAIGPHCRIHGEISTSVFLGYANKSHDGFVGHSIIGQWVNLGAGTITSNLKNTYGEVRLELPTGRLPTGRTNLGTLFGDHAKTAIGTLLSTGTVIGVGANVVQHEAPRFVRPFAWGGADRQTQDGFVTVAGRVMPRRGVVITDQLLASLRAIHGRHAR
jgi:UDP-N-acetylglucosamine diphosphorylase/glucosamine-1-phosphate N-acetyltransferase